MSGVTTRITCFQHPHNGMCENVMGEHFNVSVDRSYFPNGSSSFIESSFYSCDISSSWYPLEPSLSLTLLIHF